MQGLAKPIMNNLSGKNVRNDIAEEYEIKSKYWMQTKYDENMLNYWRLPGGD